MKNKLIALLAAGLLGAGTVAWAQTSDQDGPRGARPEGKGPMRGMERLHKKLNLNPKQEELWKQAQTTSRDAFRKVRTDGREMHQKLRAAIEKPSADLKQFAQMRDQLREQMRTDEQAARTGVRNAWFALYDTLDTNQKEQVRLAIIRGMDRMDEMRRHMHRGGPRGHAEGDGDLS
jgi:Heavy-metal resistance